MEINWFGNNDLFVEHIAMVGPFLAIAETLLGSSARRVSYDDRFACVYIREISEFEYIQTECMIREKYQPPHPRPACFS